MDTVAGILILAISVLAILAVAIGFVWAARKDGEEDRELQQRLGIRRRTRMGR
jgi:type II secretory pathway pseudopilin PulG